MAVDPSGAAAHAAVLTFVIRYGDPKIGEPLSCAWERFISTDVWKEHCDKLEAMELEHLDDERKEYGTNSIGGPLCIRSDDHIDSLTRRIIELAQ